MSDGDMHLTSGDAYTFMYIFTDLIIY
jgi:hypothetical protein